MDILEEQIYANALNLVPQLGAVRLTQVFNFFGSWKKSWEASRSGYVSAGLTPKIAEDIVSAKKDIDPPARFGYMKKLGIEIILANTHQYPQILGEISAAPPILYVRGNKKILNSTCVAVVGTRKITSYGKLATQQIVSGLAESGLTVVSGLAYGVDAEALTTATDQGGACIAVLASPLDDDSIAPKQNFQLSRKILETGCLLSEYALGANIQKGNFPVRNRIIAGLSVGTVVIEADIDSGSLITAKFALEQNREVFAVPGSIFSEVSRGTNNLIKQGAKLVTHVNDIFDELNMDPQTAEIELDITTDDNETKVMEILTRDPIHVDELTRSLQMPASQINATLALLEMKGRVKNLGGGKFAKIR